MQNKLIHFKKNNFSILVVYLNDRNHYYFKDFLLQKIKESPAFFQNQPIILNIKRLSYALNWIKLKSFILSSGFFLIGISGCSNEKIKKKILQSGLLILRENTSTTPGGIPQDMHYHYQNNATEPLCLHKTSLASLLVDQLVRSGQRIYVSSNDLIITNNVSSGAEVIADGNIHIYGTIRGRALAGASGDIHKKIFCMKLLAELIAIAGEYLTIEQIPIKFLGKSVEIGLINKKIYIRNLN
ncbi:septum site-determining protein MinC [Buchnera aphidicola]|uniref:septum site-determining protein MinC n=1 Tax=Buchnera aphidicola TaxID=9 RepID=UPI00094C2FF4|nr:septum site-determining protein MinC [Buchnera aphidicola]